MEEHTVVGRRMRHRGPPHSVCGGGVRVHEQPLPLLPVISGTQHHPVVARVQLACEVVLKSVVLCMVVDLRQIATLSPTQVLTTGGGHRGGADQGIDLVVVEEFVPAALSHDLVDHRDQFGLVVQDAVEFCHFAES